MGVAAIKQIYFYYTQRNELDMNYEDYSIIGATSGLFASQIALGGLKCVLSGCGCGLFYGFFYSAAGKYSIYKRKKKADNLEIIL